MYKRYGQKMSRLCLLFSLAVLCVLCIPLFTIKAHAQVQQADNNHVCETIDNWDVLKKESDAAWNEIFQEKLNATPPNGANSSRRKRAVWNRFPKISGTYPKTPGMILVTKDWYKGILPLGHAAMVYDKQRVVEALSYGVTFGNNDWYITRKTAFGLKVRDANKQQGKEAAEWCKKQINKPYNFAYWKPNRRDAFYCSQLVWAAYKDLYNIEVVEPRRFISLEAIYPPDLIKSKALKEVYTKIT